MVGEHLGLNGTTSSLGVQLGCRQPGEFINGLPNYFVQLRGPALSRRATEARILGIRIDPTVPLEWAGGPARSQG